MSCLDSIVCHEGDTNSKCTIQIIETHNKITLKYLNIFFSLCFSTFGISNWLKNYFGLSTTEKLNAGVHLVPFINNGISGIKIFLKRRKLQNVGNSHKYNFWELFNTSSPLMWRHRFRDWFNMLCGTWLDMILFYLGI